jgi:hypothetical protein
LKAKIQKAIYAERKADPERDMNGIKQQVAQQFDLPFVYDSIQIPDARIEYDLDQGSQSGHADVEVLTAAYRPGHLRNKAQAGFHLYASSFSGQNCCCSADGPRRTVRYRAREYSTDCTLSGRIGPRTYTLLADSGGKIELFAQVLAQFLEPGAGVAAVNHPLQKA